MFPDANIMKTIFHTFCPFFGVSGKNVILVPIILSQLGKDSRSPFIFNLLHAVSVQLTVQLIFIYGLYS